MNVSFASRLAHLRAIKQSVLCVGLDPDPDFLPSHLVHGPSIERAVEAFCCDIVEATAAFAVAFKINFAFFESLGDKGTAVLRSVLEKMPPDVITIADAKRGDIGNSAQFYARSVFEDLGFDSVTLSPYMGKDSVTPFLDYPGTCSFVLVRTSNQGGNDFQLLEVEGEPLYKRVAREALRWTEPGKGELGFVVGATDSKSMADLRHDFPNTPFLIPGVGAQGGSATEVMAASGKGPVLINSSRAILYANNSKDFAKYAAEMAEKTRLELGS